MSIIYLSLRKGHHTVLFNALSLSLSSDNHSSLLPW
jgi:hypothetical protein